MWGGGGLHVAVFFGFNRKNRTELFRNRQHYKEELFLRHGSGSEQLVEGGADDMHLSLSVITISITDCTQNPFCGSFFLHTPKIRLDSRSNEGHHRGTGTCIMLMYRNQMYNNYNYYIEYVNWKNMNSPPFKLKHRYSAGVFHSLLSQNASLASYLSAHGLPNEWIK